MSAQPARYIFWLAGRSAGAVALMLVTASVLLGLAMAARLVPSPLRRHAVHLHEHLALVGLAAVAAHGCFLAADPWLKAGAQGVLVPFAIGYRPLWTALGIVAGYLAAVLALSFYARRWIGARRWRRMHRLTVLVYALGLAHTLGAGTDAGIPLVRAVLLASTAPVLLLFGLRIARSLRSPRRAKTRAGEHPPAHRARVSAAIERSPA